MWRIDSLNRLLLAVSIVGYVVLLARLRATGLHRIYRWFFLYLVFQLIRAVVMFPVTPRTTLYGWYFVLSEPILWALYILVALELHGLLTRKHPGIAALGRRVLVWALAVALVISLAAMAPDISAGPGKYPWLTLLNVTERTIVSSLVLFLLLIAGFVAWYPVPLPSNVITHDIVFAAYFLSKNMGLLVRNITGHQVTRTVSAVFQAVACVCLVIWIAALRSKGEEGRVVLRPRFRQEDEERLMSQLDALNATLERARQK